MQREYGKSMYIGRCIVNAGFGTLEDGGSISGNASVIMTRLRVLSLQTPSTGATLLVDEQDASLRLLRTMFHIYTPVFRNPRIMAPRAWKLGLHSPLDHLWHSHRIIRYVVACSSTIRSPLFQSLYNT